MYQKSSACISGFITIIIGTLYTHIHNIVTSVKLRFHFYSEIAQLCNLHAALVYSKCLVLYKLAGIWTNLRKILMKVVAHAVRDSLHQLEGYYSRSHVGRRQMMGRHR